MDAINDNIDDKLMDTINDNINDNIIAYLLGLGLGCKNLCAAMRSCAQTQPQSLSRGRRNHVFTDHDDLYYSVGAQPGRAERGVQSGIYKMKHGFPNHHWDCIHKVLKHAEYAFNMFMDTEVICLWCKQDDMSSFKQWNHLLLCYMQSLQDTSMLSVLVLMFF